MIDLAHTVFKTVSVDSFVPLGCAMPCCAMPCCAVQGTVINKALRSAYGPSFKPCYMKSRRFFEDEPLFHCWASHGTSQRSIQLKLGQLLRELAGSSAAAAAAPSAAAAGASAMVPSSPAAAAAAAAGPGQGGVSVAALLHWVDSRVWHYSSPQLDLARRSLAKYLVHKANPGAAESPVAAVPISPDESAYTDSYSTSGMITACTKLGYGYCFNCCGVFKQLHAMQLLKAAT